MLGFLLLYGVAHKLVYYIVAGRRSRWCSASAAAISPAGPTPGTMAAFVASLVMSFLLGFFLRPRSA